MNDFAPVGVTRSKFFRGTFYVLTILHSERPKLYGVLAILSAVGLK